MNDRDQRRYDAAKRAQTFGAENGADFSAGSEAKTRFTNLDAALKTVDDAKAGQATGSGTASKVTLIDALRIDCRNIRRTAIAQEQPGFDDDFPASEHNDSSVLTAADAYLVRLEAKPDDDAAAQAAKTALVARFVAHELPATFVTDLRHDRDAIDAVSDSVEGKRQGSVEDTSVIGLGLIEAYKEIRFLNAIMLNKYSRAPEKLRAWKSATHIERAPEQEEKWQYPGACYAQALMKASQRNLKGYSYRPSLRNAANHVNLQII
ncbi:MAG: hypothetical protein QOJ45_424 [Verrucomicrobiota bacterium]|jgi:hypothetical protein